MKTKFFIILLVIGFISFHVKGQSINTNRSDSTYAMVQITSPQRVFGVYKIKIFYGNGKIEDFKNVELNSKNESDLINEITNALNYMSAKGYVLKQSLAYHLPNSKFQYIFEKRTSAK